MICFMTHGQMILGRQALVENLVQNLRQGTWAVVTGGPGMGKTTLLWQVVEHLRKHQGPQDPGLLLPAYLDLSQWRGGSITETIRPPAESKEHNIALLLDNCETLLPDPIPLIKQIQDRQLDHHLRLKVVVWAGDIKWADWVLQDKEQLGQPVRLYPLGVLIPREVRAILQHSLQSPHDPQMIPHLLLQSGGHPFILQTLLGQVIMSRQADQNMLDRSVLEYLHPFFEALWGTIKTPEEDQIIQELMAQTNWVSLEALEKLVDFQPSKSVLDRLCASGLIVRTIVEGGAALRIVSPLIRQWANTYERGFHES